MKVTVLMENATPSARFSAAHGLSLFLQAGGRKILFDTGPDGAFLDNAEVLGIDVCAADFAVVSHGHYDHGGGLRALLGRMDGREVAFPLYISAHAFEEHASKGPSGYRDIGISPDLEVDARFVETRAFVDLEKGAFLFSGVERRYPVSESNENLLECKDGTLVPDSFAHEQSLVVEENGRHILVSACSHCGILNIMERAEELAGAPLDVVIGGFHLMDPGTGLAEDPVATRALAHALATRPATTYYTFHCTGLDAFSLLRDELGSRVHYLYTGSTVNV